MKAKDAPMTKNLCQLVDQALAAAAEEVIGEVEVITDNPEEAPAEEPVVGRKKKKDIAEEPPVEEAPAEEAPAEECPEEGPHVRTALDLECMEKLKEAHRWCEETEIYGT